MMNSIISLENISKSFGGIRALSDISCQIEKGQTLGLIGENGAGKSTLMNILGGNLKPDSGSMKLRGELYEPRHSSEAANAGIAFIHQELNLFSNLSVADNLFIRNFPKAGPIIRQAEKNRKAEEWMDALKLDFSPNDLVEDLQPGERQMVEIAKALSGGAEIIIFDEPTTSLTSRETQKLFSILENLKKEGKTIIYISHILKDVKNLCDAIAVLRDGEMVSGGPAAAFSINKMIEAMCGNDIDRIFPESNPKALSEKVLHVENLTQLGVVKNITFSLHAGEVLGLFGLMGAGRSECARLLFGLEKADSGVIRAGDSDLIPANPQKCIRNRMAFVTEERRAEGLLMEASVEDNLVLVALRKLCRRTGLLNRKALIESIQNILNSLKIKSSSPRQLVKNLSGGNQQKVVIGKWLPSNPLVFILDEPTRGIDVGAKSEIYEITNRLADRGSGILFISSELEELMGLCDRILVMNQGMIVGEFLKGEFEENLILHCAFGESRGAGYAC